MLERDVGSPQIVSVENRLPVVRRADVRMDVARPDPPTVVLITSDTHRGDHLGASRLGIVIETPVLDSLARQGLLFDNCFSSTNVTRPSLA